jgi:monomeric sarcosine oxidase
MSTPGTAVDVAIIGGGTIGLSAAYYAAAAGYSTVLFEQFDFGNPRASSDGDSRMFRVMYADATMARLAEASLAQWREIEDSTGRPLLRRNGLLFYGVAAQNVEGDLSACAKVMTGLGIPYTKSGRDELLAGYPVFKALPDDYTGLYQPSGATILVKDSLDTFVSLARQHGARLLTQCPATVAPSQPGDATYTLDSPAGRFTARHLVLAPGAWSNPVLKAFGLQLQLTIWQMTVAYFRVDTSLPWPMWYEFGPQSNGTEPLFYGFPPLPGADRIKVSADYTNDKFDDPSKCTYKPDKDILSALSTFMTTRFRGAQPTPLDAMTCLYTMSADDQIILDNLPGRPNVAVLTGESGRAFKYTPLFGRILVELATTGRCGYDISEFSINRPGLRG